MIIEFRRFKDPRTLFHIYSNQRSITFRVTRYGVRVGLPAPPPPKRLAALRKDPWKRLASIPRLRRENPPQQVTA